jgi:hypothetical protein
MPEDARQEIEAVLADWRDMVRTAEQRMEALATAMEQARWAMNRLSSMASSMTEVRWQNAGPAAKAAPIAQDEAPRAPVAPEEEPPMAPPRKLPMFSEPAPWPGRREESAHNGSAHTQTPTPAEAEAPAADALREEVRQAVAAARAELEAGTLGLEDEDDVRENDSDVEEPEQYEAEMSNEAPEKAWPDSQPTSEDEDAERERVRRAVEAARAELMGIGRRGPQEPLENDQEQDEAPRAEPVRIPPQWQPAAREDASIGSPVMVIEDGEGNVELARVYEILNRLDVAAQATLINYTTHSVSIGINTREGMPDANKLEEVVKTVFGRPCQVTTEGSRLSVRLGHANGRVA